MILLCVKQCSSLFFFSHLGCRQIHSCLQKSLIKGTPMLERINDQLDQKPLHLYKTRLTECVHIVQSLTLCPLAKGASSQASSSCQDRALVQDGPREKPEHLTARYRTSEVLSTLSYELALPLQFHSPAELQTSYLTSRFYSRRIFHYKINQTPPPKKFTCIFFFN